PPVAPLAADQKTIVGYLSAGEANPDYPYFEDLRSQGILVRSSKTWPGNKYIDLRDRRWRARVYGELIPEILRHGFHGVFLDTLVSSLFLEESAPREFKGMTAAATELVLEIRRRYPKIVIVMNRAYKLLPFLDGKLDIAFGESVYSTYDFERK